MDGRRKLDSSVIFRLPLLTGLQPAWPVINYFNFIYLKNKELFKNKVYKFCEISRCDFVNCRRGAYLKVCNEPANTKASGRIAKM